MQSISSQLLTGCALGLAAGLTPGPLQMLICLQTISHGPREGAKAALAPLFTDLPVLGIFLLALSGMKDMNWLMAGISLAGTALLIRMGWGCLKARPLAVQGNIRPGSLAKGLATNALNPYMYMFWATVGAPMVLEASERSPLAVSLFLGGFYFCLLGSQLALAWLAGRYGRFLGGRGYLLAVRILGLGLWIVAARFAWEGLKRLGL